MDRLIRRACTVGTESSASVTTAKGVRKMAGISALLSKVDDVQRKAGRVAEQKPLIQWGDETRRVWQVR